MTRGDFDETAARADLDRARSRYEAARADAVRAYEARAATRAALTEAEERYALVAIFGGEPPRIGDVVRAGLAEGYPEGRIVGIRIVTPDGRTTRVSSVHLTVETPAGTYVARRLVEPRKAARS